MSSLFDTINDTLRHELVSQLSENALLVYNRPDFSVNDIYTDAAVTNGSTSRDVAIIRQILDFNKRFIGPSENSAHEVERNKACFSAFLEANDTCKRQNVTFQDLSEDTMITLKMMQDDIENSFWKHAATDEFEFAWVDNILMPISGFSTGPGSCSGVTGTSVIEKYRDKWMCSTKMGISYLQILRGNWKPMTWLPKFAAVLKSSVKASFAPKKAKISRLIAPQLNGDLFLQYPAESCLRHMLMYFGIDLETQQPRNRALARKGSLFSNLDEVSILPFNRRNLRPCTIDLTSASDIVGIELVKFCFPIPMFNYMSDCRCGTMSVSFFKGDKKQHVELEMMATMGNAYCFPMQTLVFCAAVRAIYQRLGIPLYANGAPTYGVFGDDIIVDVAAYPFVIKFLKSLHMKPNQNKCFHIGFFRESCGGDYFAGYDVRPVSTELLADDCDFYSLSNRLIDWSARHSVSLTMTIAQILQAISRVTVVPLNCGVEQGLHVPEELLGVLPPNWRKNFWATSSVDRSYVISERWLPRQWFQPLSIRLDFLPVKKALCKTQYNSYTFLCLDRFEHKKLIGLDGMDGTTLPFLRGGVSQDKKIEYLLEVPDKDKELDKKIEGIYKLVSNWNYTSRDDSDTYIGLIAPARNVYSRIVWDCIRRVEVMRNHTSSVANRKLV